MTELLFELDGARRGPAAEALSPAWLWIREGRVAYLGSDRPGAAPPGLAHLRGGWAIEALADAHVHLFLDGSFDPAQRRRISDTDRDRAVQRVLDLLEMYRNKGVAAVRDGGDPRGLVLEAARVANRRPDRFATVLPAGEPVFRSGLYGSFLGSGVESVPAAMTLLARNRDLGATHAKILATGLNSLDTPGAVGAAQFTPVDLAEITRGAREANLPTMIHANGPLRAVLETGPASVEHGFWADPADLETMALRGVPWVPTMGAWAILGEHPGLTPGQKQVVAATDRRQRQAVNRGFALGVPLATGSDAGTPGVPHGAGLPAEIGRLVEAGVPSPQALAASSHGARRLCQEAADRELGGLLAGETAGFLWLEEDPVQQTEVLHRPRGVFLGGTWSTTETDPS